MKQKETDYNVRMYACTRARVTVRRMDRPTVQPTDYANIRLPTRLSIKPFMNIVSVYDVPDFFFVMEPTEHTRPPICDTLNFNSRRRTHTNVLVCDREETNRQHKYAEHGHAEF